MPKVRNLLSRSANTIRANVTSTKSDHCIQCESTLERLFVGLAQFSRSVVTISEQPGPFFIAVGDTEFRYTPDFRLDLRDGSIVIVEVKDQRQLAKPEVAERLEAARVHIESLGYAYLIITDADLRRSPALLQNIAHLKRFQTRQPEVLAALAQLAPSKPTTVEALSASIGILPTWELIANQLVFCDITQYIDGTALISAIEENDHARLY